MMETFIVLGFCFILYEALDFFQSCYTNNNRHHQQHPQFNKDLTSASASTSVKDNLDNTDENATNDTFNDVITAMPLSDANRVKLQNSELDFVASSSHLNHEQCDDSAIEYDDNQDIDSEETIIMNQSHHTSVYSICDRVNNFNRHPLIDYRHENTTTNSDDYDKLIAS